MSSTKRNSEAPPPGPAIAATQVTPTDLPLITPQLPLLTPSLPPSRDRRGDANGGSLLKLLERLQRGERERRSFRERRASHRASVALAVEAERDGETTLRKTHDLSTFGLSVRSGATLPPGSTIALRLFLPDAPATPLKLRATVLGSFDSRGGLRLKFLAPPLEAVRRIHRLVTP